MASTTDLGKWMLTNGGEYNPETAYEQLTMVMYENSTYRFTPAHAGNTSSISYAVGGTGVHPRSRGEYCETTLIFPSTKGSPPLTRGIRRSWLMMVRCLRFTPAHAGNTK